MKKLIISFSFSLCILYSFAQDSSYKDLMSFAIQPGTFIYSKPFNLDVSHYELSSYMDYLAQDGNKVDSSVILEIINNSMNVDTSQWSESELSHLVLVNDNKVRLNVNDAVKKLSLKSRKQISFYRGIIGRYNNMEPENRRVYSYSRPVFDNSKQYAAISHMHPYGIVILLFHLENGSWKKVGPISASSF